MSSKTSDINATLADLNWMVGGWTGSLGPQHVEEAWSEATGGTMSTMIRVTTATETVMVELIVIRELANSLILHLRQYSPDLQLRLEQDMALATLTPASVAFDGPAGANIKRLTYRRMGESSMEVDVTFDEEVVVTAALTRC